MSQPDTELRIGHLRNLGTALLGSIGQVLGAQSCGPSVTAGFIAEPFALPRDYDRSRPGFLFALISPTSIIAPEGNVRLDTTVTVATPPLTITNPFFHTLVPIEADPVANRTIEVPLLSPTGDPALPPSSPKASCFATTASASSAPASDRRCSRPGPPLFSHQSARATTAHPEQCHGAS